MQAWVGNCRSYIHAPIAIGQYGALWDGLFFRRPPVRRRRLAPCDQSERRSDGSERRSIRIDVYCGMVPQVVLASKVALLEHARPDAVARTGMIYSGPTNVGPSAAFAPVRRERAWL